MNFHFQMNMFHIKTQFSSFCKREKRKYEIGFQIFASLFQMKPESQIQFACQYRFQLEKNSSLYNLRKVRV